MEIKRADSSINEIEWHKVVDSNEYIVSLREHENLNFDLYDYALLKIGNEIFGRLLWNWDKGKVGIEIKERYLPKVHEAISKIATELEAEFYYNTKELFDSKRHLPMPQIEIDRSDKYFEDHDLDHIRWMAFREEDRMVIMKALKLEESKEFNLKDGVDGNEFIVAPTYSGWTFFMGDDLPNLLIKGDESSSEEALTNLCKSIQKLSKKFTEVQYFEYQGKSNITGYFKANNGKLNFGYWKSETEEFCKGRVPKEIKKLHPTSAHEVASIWSIDPLDFIYLKEMVEEKSYVVAPI